MSFFDWPPEPRDEYWENYDMLPRGYYSGKGPWWLVGWKGKVFNEGWGYNVFRHKEHCLPFVWKQEGEAIRITYSLAVPLLSFEDVMVPDGDRWKGKIYMGKVKVGTFELRKGEQYGR